MSIEVTRLTYKQGTDHAYIKEWFDTNASEYFDESYLEDGKALRLRNGDRDFLFMSHDECFTVRVLVNGNMTLYMDNGVAHYISRLAKTPHGVAVGFARSGEYGFDFPYGLFITKTNKGNTGLIGNTILGEQAGAGDYFFESIGGSKHSIPTAITPNVIWNDVTTFTPVVCDKASGEYMPDCFFTTFSQYKELDCTFVAEGTEYLYNGFIAMR